MNPSTSFQALRQQGQAHWAAMVPRERQLIAAAAGLAALLLLVFAGVRPAWRTLNETPAQMREITVELERMRRLADEAKLLRARPLVPPAQAEAALKAATERLGPGAQLNLQGDRATVTLSKVDGADLVTWLAEARAGARVRPLEAQLSQVAPGLYSGSIVVALAAEVPPR